MQYQPLKMSKALSPRAASTSIENFSDTPLGTRKSQLPSSRAGSDQTPRTEVVSLSDADEDDDDDRDVTRQATRAIHSPVKELAELEKFLEDTDPIYDASRHSSPEHHRVDVLVEARSNFGGKIQPPFCVNNPNPKTKKAWLARVEGQEWGQIEVVFRPWKGPWWYGTIDFEGKRRIVKNDGTGRFEYHEWLGLKEEFSKDPIAYQTTKPPSLLAKRKKHSQRQRRAHPKGWASKEHDEDSDFNRAEGSKSARLRGRQRRHFELSSGEEILTPPLSTQGSTTEPGKRKEHAHDRVDPGDADNLAPPERAKATEGTRSHRAEAAPTPHSATHDQPLALKLSPYKQENTVIRTPMIGYRRQFVQFPLGFCPTITAFFSTTIDISEYKGARDDIRGISATFDCKMDDDAHKTMLIREDYPFTYDMFIKKVDGAESWPEDGEESGQCSVSVRFLLK